MAAVAAWKARHITEHDKYDHKSASFLNRLSESWFPPGRSKHVMSLSFRRFPGKPCHGMGWTVDRDISNPSEPADAVVVNLTLEQIKSVTVQVKQLSGFQLL